MTEETIKNEMEHLERIGVVGSPSSTRDLSLDILGSAAEKKLIGSLGLIGYPQDGQNHHALGQITEINMQNVWSQDPTMKSLIRQKGVVDPITGTQDTHSAKMIISSVFSEDGLGNIEPSILGTVPSTGTPIRLVNDVILKKLLTIYQNEIFYLGKIYGNNILLPTWFKHFAKGEKGANEAYHLGIFGKTGSGKSFIAKMVSLGYARHRDMSMFILDPQGEFSTEIKNENSTLKKGLNKLGKKSMVVDLHSLVLSGNDLFKQLLIEMGFFKELTIKNFENQKNGADEIVSILEGRSKGTSENNRIKLWDAYKEESFNRVWRALQNEVSLGKIYKDKKLHSGITSTMETEGKEKFYSLWKKVANLFSYTNKNNGKIIKEWVDELFDNEDKPVVSIDLSSKENSGEIFWNDNVKSIVIRLFLSTLTEKAEEKYKRGENLNTLVIIDEAHRLAPRETEDEIQESVKKTLIDAVRTTRKYGLGWMFISQTLSSLHREIITQMRILLFGFGLGWGVELRALEDLIGGNKEAINLYQSFKDPQAGIGKREYPFMCVGPISPLSFSSTPLFLNALDYNEGFGTINDLN